MGDSDDDNNRGRVWEELRSQRDLLVEMKTMLSILTAQKDDHETRLRKLEERRFPLQTVAVIASTLAMMTGLAALLLKL